MSSALKQGVSTSTPTTTKEGQSNVIKLRKYCKYQCGVCGRQFAKNCNLHDHVQRVHDKIARFNCEICQYQCFSRAQHRYHNRTSHAKLIAAEFQCHLCVCGYTSKWRLQNHIRVNHWTRESFQKCNLCKIKLATIDELLHHPIVCPKNSGVRLPSRHIKSEEIVNGRQLIWQPWLDNDVREKRISVSTIRWSPILRAWRFMT
jgi:hypothetical protein